jgi:rhamnose utilization protein RhaD (predicted bifunctional aldolase and dehydrogenase)
LVKIDLEGRILDDTPFDVNPAGFTIHSAVHSARHDAACVLHTHTVAGVGVSSLACGLQPCNQWALEFYNRVVYHDFEGIALDDDERERLVADLGPTAKAMILRNHGLLTLGHNIPEAFILMPRAAGDPVQRRGDLPRVARGLRENRAPVRERRQHARARRARPERTRMARDAAAPRARATELVPRLSAESSSSVVPRHPPSS